MAGTKIGGLRAKKTNIAKYGEDFYAVMGKKSWVKRRLVPVEERTPWGFRAMGKEQVSVAGRKGGTISSRKGVKTGMSADPRYRREA